MDKDHYTRLQHRNVEQYPPNSTVPDSTVSTDEGLSTAAEAGIAVAVILIALGALGLIIWACARRR